MNQLLALKIKPPQFDLPGAASATQDYRRGEMDNQLAALKLQDAQDQFGAEGRFRQRSASGDPDADEELAGYPEMRRKIVNAFDGMSPANYKKATQKAARFGEAARNILLFKDGSPEQG